MAEYIPPLLLEIKAKADELYAELDKVKKEVSGTADESASRMDKFNEGFKKASGGIALAGAGIIGAVAGVAIEAASAAEVVDVRLKTAIENAGGSMEELEPKIQTLDGTMRDLGFTNEQTNEALGTMTTALKDPEEAMNAMGVAADLARAKHIELNDAALMVTKAMEGQTKPLKALGIDLPVHAGNAVKVADAQNALAKAQQGVNDILAEFPDAADPASAAHDKYLKATQNVDAAQEKLTTTQAAGEEIMKDLTDRIHGQASAFGDTLQGKLETTKASFADLSEKLGTLLLPILKTVVDWVQKFADWAEKNPVLFNIIIGVIGFLVVAITALAAATWIMNSALFAADGALAPILLPILAIIAAIAALIAIIILVASNWDAIVKWISDVWNGFVGWLTDGLNALAKWWNDTWAGIQQFFTDAFNNIGNFIADWWPFILGLFTGGIGLVVGLVIQHWGEIVDFTTKAFTAIGKFISDAMNGIFSFLKDVGANISGWWNGLWSGMIDFFKNIFSGISDFIGGVFRGIGNAIIDMLNWTMGPVNMAVDGINLLLDGIKNATGGAISLHVPELPTLPHFADGGTIPGVSGAPQLVVAHGGEFVLSREMLAGTARIPQGVQMALANQGAGTVAGSGQTIIVNAQTNATPSQIASSVGWLLRQMG